MCVGMWRMGPNFTLCALSASGGGGGCQQHSWLSKQPNGVVTDGEDAARGIPRRVAE